MQPVFIFSNNQKQLKDFCKTAFLHDIKAENEFFSHKTLDIHTSTIPVDILSKKAIIVFLDVTENFCEMQIEKGALLNQAIKRLCRYLQTTKTPPLFAAVRKTRFPFQVYTKSEYPFVCKET